MPKILPCSRCGDARTASGDPFLVASISNFPYIYKCSCKRVYKLTATDFNRLPSINPDECPDKS